MAEPLFIVADIDLSAPALRRWLKSAPQSVAAFDDWPESVRLGAPGLTELAAPMEPCVADALVSYCVDSFGREDGHLHCRHDEQAHALRFAACFQYGDEAGALASALFSAPCCAGWRRPTRQGSPHSSACSTPTTIWSASGSASSPRASCPLRRMRGSRPMVRRLDQPGQPGRSGQAHGRAVPAPGPRPEEAVGAGRAASQPGCAPPLRQPLLDRRRACVSMARRPACARRRPGLSGGSRPPTPWTRRSTRMDDRSGTTAPWWGRARTGA